jgi:hypothetical protein
MLSIGKHMIYNKERPKEFCREEKKKKVVKNKKLPSPVKEKGGKSVVFTEGNTSKP